MINSDRPTTAERTNHIRLWKECLTKTRICSADRFWLGKVCMSPTTKGVGRFRNALRTEKATTMLESKTKALLPTELLALSSQQTDKCCSPATEVQVKPFGQFALSAPHRTVELLASRSSEPEQVLAKPKNARAAKVERPQSKPYKVRNEQRRRKAEVPCTARLRQNRRQKVANRGLYVCAGGFTFVHGGLDIQIWQKFHLQCFIFQLWGNWSFAWGLRPQKPPVATGLVCALVQQNVKFSSNNGAKVFCLFVPLASAHQRVGNQAWLFSDYVSYVCGQRNPPKEFKTNESIDFLRSW